MQSDTETCCLVSYNFCYTDLILQLFDCMLSLVLVCEFMVLGSRWSGYAGKRIQCMLWWPGYLQVVLTGLISCNFGLVIRCGLGLFSSSSGFDKSTQVCVVYLCFLYLGLFVHLLLLFFPYYKLEGKASPNYLSQLRPKF